jgi:hypothetical protein
MLAEPNAFGVVLAQPPSTLEGGSIPPAVFACYHRVSNIWK